MFEGKHLSSIRDKFADSNGLSLKETILCAIALGEKLLPGFSDNREIGQTLSSLRRYKFIRRVSGIKTGRYALTTKGEIKLRSIIIDEIEIKTPRSWDGKWRLVMYDLPVRFKKARNAFRWKLKDLGFFQLQKSAWIYPYPCEGELLFVADFYGVRKHIEILEIDKVLNDKKLKAHFGL